VPTTPDSHQRDTLGEICHSSIGVVVTSPYARQALNQYYYVPSEKITVLPRGVGQLQPADREALKGISGLQGKTVLCTCGALGPDSGLEYGLEALARVLKTHPDVHYFIAGETHPDMPAGQGDAWRAALAGLVQALGIGAHVHFINRPLALAEQQNFLQMADIYLAPCPSWLQTTSSLLAHAVGCGRAAVAAPSLHAQEMLAEGRGMLAHFQDAQSLARCINTLIENPVLKESMEACALRYGKEMAWPKVARHYEDYFTATAAEYRLPVS